MTRHAAAAAPRVPGRAARPVDRDRGLVARLKKGDAPAFEEVLRRYELKVYGLVLGLMRNEDDARDATQDAFLNIFKNIRRFKGQSTLSTWIYRVAVNAALMRLRKRRGEPLTVPIEDHLPDFETDGHRVAVVPDWHPRVDDLLLNKERRALLRQWIAELAPEYRTVLVLRDQQGLENEEVASVLNLSVAAVKSRLHRARLYLRQRAKSYVYAGN